MKVLLLGANGATGRFAVNQCMGKGINVKAIIRSQSEIPEIIKSDENVQIIREDISHLNEQSLINHVEDCEAVISCLGHNLTLRGIYGPPGMLVTNAVKKICNVINQINTSKPVKFILMNTSGYIIDDKGYIISLKEKIVLTLMHHLLPPLRDSEESARYLQNQIGDNNPKIEWIIVRPDTLINEKTCSEYEVYSSPVRSPIFNSGKTSRINVGNFMANLLSNDNLWNTWKFKMPVIYNKHYLTQDK
jgi:putative NADH-flavin reductase